MTRKRRRASLSENVTFILSSSELSTPVPSKSGIRAYLKSLMPIGWWCSPNFSQQVKVESARASVTPHKYCGWYQCDCSDIHYFLIICLVMDTTVESRDV